MSNTDDSETIASDEDMAAQYIQWTENALNEMDAHLAAFAALAETDIEHGVALVKEVYGLSHNMKGLGSSFNYNLMTEIGDNLCDYINRLPPKKMPSFSILDVHVRAFHVIIGYKIVGTAGAKGEAIIARLKTLVNESLAA